MSRTISDRIRLIIDANPNRALAQIRRFNAGLRRIAIGAQQVQMALASIAFVAGGAFGFIAKQVVGFDDALRKMRSKLDRGVGADKLEELADSARELGRTTSYTQTEVAKMFVTLAQSGKSADEILEMAEAMVMFGRASDMGSLDESAAALTKMLSMWGKNASDAEHFSDVLVYGANNANTSVAELAEGMRMLGPLMSNMANADFELAVAQLAILADSAESSSRGGRGSRSGMLQIFKDGVEEEFQSMGVDTRDDDGNLRATVDLLGEAHIKMKTWKGDFKKLNFLAVVNGKIGLNTGSIIAKNADEIKEMAMRMRSLVDETKIANMLLEGGVGGALRRLKSAFDGLVQAMGKDLIGNLALLSNTLIKGVLEPLTRAVETTQNFGAKLGLLAAGAGLGSIAAGLTAIAAIIGANLIGAFTAMATMAIAAFKNVLRTVLFLAKHLAKFALLPLAIGAAFVLLSQTLATSAKRMAGLTNPIELINRSLNGIVDALVQGDWASAMEILEQTFTVAVAAMKVEWAEFVGEFNESLLNMPAAMGVMVRGLFGTQRFVDAGKKAMDQMVDEVNATLPEENHFTKTGGLYDDGTLGDRFIKQLPADMNKAFGGSDKAMLKFKQLRDKYAAEAYDKEGFGGHKVRGPNAAPAAQKELEEEQKALEGLIEKQAELKAAALAAGETIMKTKARRAQAQAQENYDNLKSAEALKKLEDAKKHTASIGRAEDLAGISNFFNTGMERMKQGFKNTSSNMVAQAQWTGKAIGAAFWHDAMTKQKDYKRRMNEIKDIVREISFGKVGNFDLGTAMSEFNKELNKTASKQLEAQLRTAKSNGEILEVLKNNGLGGVQIGP